MRLKVLSFICFFFSLLLFDNTMTAGADEWLEEKGQHFIVYHSPFTTKKEVRIILRRAESFYTKIGAKIGYSRYANFWTWDERVKIFVYPNKQTFVQQTGQPDWSTGFAVREKFLFDSRAIVSYPQEEGLYEEILPHEISHLILRDFLGEGVKIPIWFDEGVAQLTEKYKFEQADKMMKYFVKKNQYVKFNFLFNWDVRKEKDTTKVMMFYAQSLSVIDFMISKYGSIAFGRLCREMEKGRTFTEALKTAYTSTIGTVEQLEKKWVQHMNR